MLEIFAPAKINLTLEVLGKRPDGFHEIRSVAQTISLGDCLRFQMSDTTELSCSNPDWVLEKSLVSQAVNLLRETAGCAQGASVAVDERIPLVSGLGGDSSDAAAALCGLNQLWGLGLSREELLRLAAQLGSDVPFLLYGGTALLEGRGELITSLPSPPRLWVVVVIPDMPRLVDKTKQLYQSLVANHYTEGEITRRLVEVLGAGGEVDSPLLFNTFENVAFTCFPGLSVYRSHMLKIGASSVHLAGSGPALFTIVKDWPQARDLCLRLKEQKMECYLAHTLSAIEKSAENAL